MTIHVDTFYHRKTAQFSKSNLSYRLLLIEKENKSRIRITPQRISNRYIYRDIKPGKLSFQRIFRNPWKYKNPTILLKNLAKTISNKRNLDRPLNALWCVVDRNRGRPGPEPAGWTGAVVPSPPPPAPRGRDDATRRLVPVRIACYRPTPSWRATQLLSNRVLSRPRIGGTSCCYVSNPSEMGSENATRRRISHTSTTRGKRARCRVARLRVRRTFLERKFPPFGGGRRREAWTRDPTDNWTKFRCSANIRCACVCMCVYLLERERYDLPPSSPFFNVWVPRDPVTWTWCLHRFWMEVFFSMNGIRIIGRKVYPHSG